ncbi:hypothetical protein DK265_06375 [Pseudomonas aeruginosa]|nr:hypothetical protein DK265_06375 [Pseudomonas aeruginosa]
MQGLAMFSAYIIEVHGDFECISIGDPMLTGSKQLEVDLRSNHCQGSARLFFSHDFLLSDQASGFASDSFCFR